MENGNATVSTARSDGEVVGHAPCGCPGGTPGWQDDPLMLPVQADTSSELTEEIVMSVTGFVGTRRAARWGVPFWCFSPAGQRPTGPSSNPLGAGRMARLGTHGRGP